MTKKMTKREIEDACYSYLSKAISNSNLAQHEVLDRIKTATKDIIAIAWLLPDKGKDFRFSTNQKVLIVMSAMRKDIIAIIKNRVDIEKNISSRLNKKLGIEVTDWDAVDWIDSERYGKSYGERLGIYSQRLRFELELYIAIGQDKGFDQFQTYDMFMSNIFSPTTSTDALDATLFKAALASRLMVVPFGGYKSGMRSIERLNNDMLMVAYHTSNRMSWSGKKMFKYILTANDSTVCATCQGNVGFTFPAEEMIVPVHQRCRCQEIPILIND